MKCLYYLTSTLSSTNHINNHLHKAGISDWFIHVLSKDEAGLRKMKIHSSNYLEQLDLLRFGIMGAIIGFLIGLLAANWLESAKPFGPDVPNIVYFAVVGVLTCFGAWEGGLIGIANENKKVSLFHDDIENGKYLILIYARREHEAAVKTSMSSQHPEAQLVAEDEYFYNPLSGLKRI